MTQARKNAGRPVFLATCCSQLLILRRRFSKQGANLLGREGKGNQPSGSDSQPPGIEAGREVLRHRGGGGGQKPVGKSLQSNTRHKSPGPPDLELRISWYQLFSALSILVGACPPPKKGVRKGTTGPRDRLTLGMFCVLIQRLSVHQDIKGELPHSGHAFMQTADRDFQFQEKRGRCLQNGTEAQRS